MLLRSGQAGQRQRALEVIEQAAGQHPTDEERRTLRDLLLEALALTDLAIDRSGPVLPSDGNGLAFDARSERWALSRADGTITIHRTADGEELLRLAGGPAQTARLEFDPTGRYLAVRSYKPPASNTVRVWDLERRAPVPGLPEGLSASTRAFSPRGGLLAVAERDPSLSLYTLPDSREPRVLPLGDSQGVAALAFSPDGQQLAVASKVAAAVGANGSRWQVLRVDVETGKVENLHGSADMIGAISWHPDGSALAWSTADKSITVADLRGTVLARLHGHTAVVEQLAFTPDGRFLVSVAPPDGLCVWDPLLARPVVRLPLEGAFSLAPHGEILGAAQIGASSRLCRLVSSEVRLLTPSPALTSSKRSLADGAAAVRSLSFHPDGCLLASGDGAGVLLWDTNALRSVARLVPSEADPLPFVLKPEGPKAQQQRERGPIRAMGRVGTVRDRLKDLPRWSWALFAPSGQLLYGDFQSGLFGRDVQRLPGRLRVGSQVPPPLGKGEHGRFRNVALSGDGRTLAGLEPGWPRSDLVTVVHMGEPGSRWPAGRDLVGVDHLREVALTGDGRLAAASTSWRHVRIWDVRTGEVVRDLPELGVTLDFSPDGAWLATGVAGEYRLCDTQTWEVRRRFARSSASEAGPMAFAPDSTLLALVPGLASVRLVHTERAEELATLPIPRIEAISALRFSSDGIWLAIGTERGVIHLWNLGRARSRLHDLGLDWDLPCPRDVQNEIPPLRVEVD
jgi:WD40 repeat protein